MPYVRDGSLRELLDRRGRLSLKESLRIIRDIAEALHYAHAMRVVHCDVKPENVLLSAGHAMIADFGISRAVRQEMSGWRAPTSPSGGTPAYVSPEQASGEPVLGPTTDQFSLACVLFEMLVGRPPFEAESELALLAQRFTQPAPELSRFNRTIPERVSRIVRRAMSREPRRRYRSTDAFMHAYERAVERSALPFIDTLHVALVRAVAWFRWLRRSYGRRPRIAARHLVAQSRHSLETARLGARATTGANLGRNTLGG